MKPIKYISPQVLLVAAVSAEAEADAQYLSTYGVHTPVVASTYHHGLGHSVVAPAVHSVAAPVSTYSHSVATPVVSSYSNILNRGVYGLNSGVYGLNRGVYGSVLGGHYYGKREAEAEAEPEADAQYIASTYAHGVHAPVVTSTYAHNVVAPAVHTVAAPVISSAYSHAVPAVHSVATPVVSSYSNILNRGVYGLNRGVYGLNHGVYGSALGGHYYGKREAEAEAEAEPYTIAQVANGLPIANAYATGHPHNVGYTRFISGQGIGYNMGYNMGYNRGYTGHYYG